ncbi:MAG TPA: fimbrial protein [Rhodanobacteraceae bacterium]|jgi:major type 1 subunit fimbrin (pilin)|nr:fimbrial protein [Rhodanobacteraceae bacterium]
MNLKPTLLATGMALALGTMALAPQAAHATADGTVTIGGKVLNGTCSVSGNGSPANTAVTLADVQQSALTATGAYTASQQKFSIDLTNCPTTPSGVQVGLQFFGGNDSSGAGLLTSTGTATGVEVQLLDSSKNAVTITSAQPTDNSNVTDATTLSGASATLDYYAQYYVTSATPGAGTVEAQTSFVINYQ